MKGDFHRIGWINITSSIVCVIYVSVFVKTFFFWGVLPDCGLRKMSIKIVKSGSLCRVQHNTGCPRGGVSWRCSACEIRWDDALLSVCSNFVQHRMLQQGLEKYTKTHSTNHIHIISIVHNSMISMSPVHSVWLTLWRFVWDGILYIPFIHFLTGNKDTKPGNMIFMFSHELTTARLSVQSVLSQLPCCFGAHI